MWKGYIDGSPWHGNQVRMGLVLIHSWSESGCDVVIQAVQVCIRVGAEQRQKRWSGGRGSWRWLEVGREGEGRSYHDREAKAARVWAAVEKEWREAAE